MDNLRANVGRLYFGGEGTSRKYFGKLAASCRSLLTAMRLGFLHGAYFEGLSMGQTIAGCIKNTTCPPLKQFANVLNAIPYELD